MPLDAVGRDSYNTNILDASLRTLALAPLEQMDGVSAFSVENAIPSREAETLLSEEATTISDEEYLRITEKYKNYDTAYISNYE